MNDYVVFSLRHGMSILADAAISRGYDRENAELLVRSALWLESTHYSGVNHLIAYLILIKGYPLSTLKPWRHPRYQIAGRCPIYLAKLIIDIWTEDPDRQDVALGAPASPLLFMPLIVEWVGKQGKSVRLQHWHYSCLFSARGWVFESNKFGGFGLINIDGDSPMLLTRVNDPVPRERLTITEVSLPACRLRSDNTLDIDRG